MTVQPTAGGGTLRFALLGVGRWGSRLASAIGRLDGVDLCAVADSDAAARARARTIAPRAQVVRSLDDLLALGPDAVLLATPPSSHAAEATRVLEARRHLFVEKPLTTCASEARELCAIAEGSGLVAMVGHVLRFHPAYEALGAFVRDGRLGTAVELVARRLTGSRSPSALWSLAPHDLATLHALDPSDVVELRARRAAPSPGLADDASGERAVRIDLCLASGLRAELLLSTAATAPSRRFELRGTRGRVVADELGVERTLWQETCSPEPLVVAEGEPLLRELDHFAACIRSGRPPRSSLPEGAWVVDVIERAAEQLDVQPPTGTRARPRSVAPESRPASFPPVARLAGR